MPATLSPTKPRSGITKFTGGRLVKGDSLIEEDLWISSVTGKILHSQEVFYEHHAVPDEVVDLRGKIMSPGFIDVVRLLVNEASTALALSRDHPPARCTGGRFNEIACLELDCC